MVFQDLALWPHMTVRENIAFVMVGKEGFKKSEEGSLAGLLNMTGLERYRNSYPHQLSGGEKQRLALARALAQESRILLLDEPLSNLDSMLRHELRQEIKNILNKMQITALYVTHDQEEAIFMADRIAVMNKGQIEQVGTYSEIINNPATAFVKKCMCTEYDVKRSENHHNHVIELVKKRT
jgi:ABC-type Fe3+/spermidine/putrescine transport system ATPase subunit